jgi:hypothetical protein
MPSQEARQLPKDIKVVKFLPGEFQPLIVAGKDIEKIVIGYSAKTASNDRSRKVGPPYFIRGGRPYYLVQDLVEHFTKNFVKTSNE